MANATYFETVVTRQGLNYITEAHPTGTLVDVAYFVPMYDYRIDPTIMEDGIQLSAFSDVAQDIVDTSATEPEGEYIWNVSSESYSISDVNFLINKDNLAGTYNNGVLENPIQTQKSDGVNLYNGIPLTNSVSGTSLNYVKSTNLWDVEGYNEVSGNNDQPDETFKNNLFRVSDYHPVKENDSSDNLRANFTCRLNANIGKFKFNKIALYCVKRDIDGNQIDDPVYFGEAFIQEPVLKTQFASSGMDDYTFNIQFSFETVTPTDDEVFYSSLEDYWNRTVGGVHYPLKVGVGAFETQPDILANTHIKRTRTGDNASYEDIPQLRIDYDDEKFMSFKVLSNGHIEIDTYPDVSIKPNYKISLGSDTMPFKKLFLKNIDGSSIDINDSEVKIGHGSTNVDWDTKSIISKNAIEIINDSNKLGYFKGGDLFRDDENMFIYNTIFVNAPTKKHIGIFAGVRSGNNISWDVVNSNQGDGPTHLNMDLKLLDQNDFNFGLEPKCNLYFGAKGKIKNYGILEINPLISNNNKPMLEFSHFDAYISTNIKSDKTISDIGVALDSSHYEKKTALESVIDSSNLYLLSRNLHVFGTVRPIGDGVDFGTDYYRFNNGYFKNINIFEKIDYQGNEIGRVYNGQIIDMRGLNQSDYRHITIDNSQIKYFKLGKMITLFGMIFITSEYDDIRQIEIEVPDIIKPIDVAVGSVSSSVQDVFKIYTTNTGKFFMDKNSDEAFGPFSSTDFYFTITYEVE